MSLVEQAILSEVRQLRKDTRLAGVYVVPSTDSLFEWHGTLFVRMGIFFGSSFKFILTVPDNYPASRPTVRFISRVVHPLVSPSTGEVNLAFLFGGEGDKDHHGQQYSKESGGANGIRTVLSALKSIFYPITSKGGWAQFDPKLNAAIDDGKHFKRFKSEVNHCVIESKDSALLNPPNFALRYSEFKECHQLLLDEIMRPAREDHKEVDFNEE